MLPLSGGLKTMIPQSGSFSGADIVATVYVPTLQKYMVFGELATISYSIHRELNPVRALGTINPKGYCRGPRTTAGSLIFTVFDRHVLYEAQTALREKYKETLIRSSQYGLLSPGFVQNIKFITDEIPPFDVIINMRNEMNLVGSKLIIKGIRIVNEGQTMSINDLITENVMQYVANGIDLMEPTFVSE